MVLPWSRVLRRRGIQEDGTIGCKKAFASLSREVGLLERLCFVLTQIPSFFDAIDMLVQKKKKKTTVCDSYRSLGTIFSYDSANFLAAAILCWQGKGRFRYRGSSCLPSKEKWEEIIQRSLSPKTWDRFQMNGQAYKFPSKLQWNRCA